MLCYLLFSNQPKEVLPGIINQTHIRFTNRVHKINVDFFLKQSIIFPEE